MDTLEWRAPLSALDHTSHQGAAGCSVFQMEFTRHLHEHYFAGQTAEFFASPEYQNALNEHLYARTERFGRHLAPWISTAFDLSGANVLEIGSGTGALTAVFAPLAEQITCFDTDERSLRAARRRAELMGWRNVEFAGEFGPCCHFVTEERKADAAIFVGVVEHLDFPTFESLVGTAWRALRPGGVLIVADTPNRLCTFDYHSAWLPFFQWLPDDVRRRYYERSPRHQLVHDLVDFKKQGLESVSARLQSWGNGVSFHDFELVLGPQVHDWIVADGWSEHIYPLASVFPDDRALLAMFEDPHYQIRAHRGWARSWLYLIFRKPT